VTEQSSFKEAAEVSFLFKICFVYFVSRTKWTLSAASKVQSLQVKQAHFFRVKDLLSSRGRNLLCLRAKIVPSLQVKSLLCLQVKYVLAGQKCALSTGQKGHCQQVKVEFVSRFKSTLSAGER
jgi:hypothetical protein